MKTKAIGYIRVSTADQANSLEVQTKRIQDYCYFKEIDLQKIYVDEDVSGGKPFYSRQGGSEANKALINSEVSTIVCVKPDRLFRNVKDALITVDDWSANKIALHIVDLGGNSIDTQTAMGRMFFIQSVSMAEFERKITGERTKTVLNHKKHEKKAYCAGVYGYDNVDGKMIENVNEMAVVRKIKVWHNQNYSAARIASLLNGYNYKAKKGGAFHPSAIQNIIKNSVYDLHI